MKRNYNVVDVFTSRPLFGNPVGVVLEADDLSTEAMQAVAAWTNLSETTFVLNPTTAEADYRVRIFTPRNELPFAGHPTLGTAHALLEAGRVKTRDRERLVQQAEIGLVNLTVSGNGQDRKIAFDLPGHQIQPVADTDIAELEQILGCSVTARVPPGIVTVGPVWLIANIEDAEALLNLRPDFTRLAEFERRLGITGVTTFGPHTYGDAAIEVRTFAPSCGVEEDPVCGSGNASVAALQWERGLTPLEGTDYVAAQGRRVGRDGRVHVSISAEGKVKVGGSCITCLEGSLDV